MKILVKTKVIKRNGEEVGFDLEKIENAIRAANEEVDNIYKLNEFQVRAIADDIAGQVKKSTHAIHVEDIQDMVETGIMGMRGYEVAQKYVRYRYKRELARKSNTTDNGILALIDNLNEAFNQENSNKNPVINSTQTLLTNIRFLNEMKIIGAKSLPSVVSLSKSFPTIRRVSLLSRSPL